MLINGKLEGLYVAVEQVDAPFARARFGEGGQGNVFKEIWPVGQTEETLRRALETNKKEAPSMAPALAFQDAVLESDEALERFVDRAYMARYLAVDRVIINDDGAFRFFCFGPSGVNHNYYWYQARDAARFWLIPWDLDTAFDGAPSHSRIDPPWYEPAPSCTCDAALNRFPSSCNPLVQRLHAWRADYEREVDSFLAGPFSQANVEAKLSAYTAQIAPFVAEAAALVVASPSEATWQDALASLRAIIASARSHRGYAYARE